MAGHPPVDMTLAELFNLLDDAQAAVEVIAEARDSDTELKELILLIECIRPLHVSIVVDEARQQERVITVYEPYPSAWTATSRSSPTSL